MHGTGEFFCATKVKKSFLTVNIHTRVHDSFHTNSEHMSRDHEKS